jgi:ABC-2 type transport system permease protein
MSILTSSMFGIGMTVVVNRRSNLLKRYLATPMRPGTYILSFIIGRGIILLFESLALLSVGALFFKFHIAGSIPLFFLLSVLGTSCFTALAFVVASRTSDTGLYNGVANLLILPLLLLSGVWFSRASLPVWLAEGTSWTPLVALVDGLRKIALDGAGFQQVWHEVAILALFTAFFVILARRLFRWTSL